MDTHGDFKLLSRDELGALGSPLRRELLAALAEPDSAANLARRFDMSRQRVGYHMRELAQAGVIELAGERRQRGLTERLFRARPVAYLDAPSEVLPPAQRERYAWLSLVNLLARSLWDLVCLRRRADAAGKRLASLAFEVELTFGSARARRRFTEDLVAAVERVVAAHDHPGATGGRRFRLVLGAYPALQPQDTTGDFPDGQDAQH